MRDGGDFVPTLETPIIPRDMINSAFNHPLPGFTRPDNTGDHVGLSGGGSHLQKVERNIKIRPILHFMANTQKIFLN